MSKIDDAFHIAWTIALKDLRDAFVNKSTRTNILILCGLVLFFYWASTIRPFDKRVSIVVYDQGSSDLNFESKELSDGTILDFRPASSLEEMEKKLAYQDLGLVIPAAVEQESEFNGDLILSGYVHWAKRGQVAELEEEYSAFLSELLGTSVVVEIGDNILLPPIDALGAASTASLRDSLACIFVNLSAIFSNPFVIGSATAPRGVGPRSAKP